MKSLCNRGALVVSALLLSFLLFSARPSLAETLLSGFQEQSGSQQKTQPPAATGVSFSAVNEANPSVVSEKVETVPAATNPAAKPVALKPAAETPAAEPVHYIATAYSLRGRTASGRYVSKGIIAADPRILPLGSRVRLEAGAWSGEYLVADTGGAIRGRKIDIWTPSSGEAMRFGKRKVKLTVLSYPARRSPRKRA